VKILYVTAGLPYSSGQEEFFIPEIAELTRRGHRLLIVPRQKMGSIGGAEARLLLGAARALPLLAPEVAYAALSEFCRRPGTCMRNLWTACSKGEVVKRLKNLAVFPKALWLARVAWEFGAQHIHVQWLGTTASMGLVAHHIAGIPWSVTAHRWDIADNNLLEEKMRDASFVRFISNKSMKLAQSLCSFDIVCKSFVLHLGVRMPGGVFSPAAGFAARRFVCPANMIRVKGHKHLLRTMVILKGRGVECELLLAGDGPLRKDLEKMVHSLGVSDRVRFLGRLPHDELLSLYRRGEIGMVVLPSVDLGGGEHEGIPICLVEAMAHRVPVVSTDTGGIPELLAGGCGMLVPAANPDALARSIERVLSDSELRHTLSVEGRRRVEEEYAVERIVDELERHMEANSQAIESR
jgi:glycosyltransferase involved in cell wall biosynthesis